MKILVLNEQDIKKIFTMKDAIQASKDALEFYSKNETNTPLRVNINVPKHEGQSLYMPGYVEGAKALGLKIVSIYPKNVEKGLASVPASMILLDDETGEICGIMDGTYLTRLRTGAVSGAATEILSRKDSKIFAIFGTGGQAECQVEAVLNVRDIEEVRIYGRRREKTEDFVRKMSDKFSDMFKVKFVSAENAEEAVKDADIITAVTTAKEPVFDGRLVKKGAHINGVGSYTPEMHEIDEYTLINADKVYVDTREGVLSESADFITPIRDGKFAESDITGELGEAIMGKVPLREKEDEITFFKSVGSGVLDVVTARRIYEKAIDGEIGQIIEM